MLMYYTSIDFSCQSILYIFYRAVLYIFIELKGLFDCCVLRTLAIKKAGIRKSLHSLCSRSFFSSYLLWFRYVHTSRQASLPLCGRSEILLQYIVLLILNSVTSCNSLNAFSINIKCFIRCEQLLCLILDVFQIL